MCVYKHFYTHIRVYLYAYTRILICTYAYIYMHIMVNIYLSGTVHVMSSVLWGVMINPTPNPQPGEEGFFC